MNEANLVDSCNSIAKALAGVVEKAEDLAIDGSTGPDGVEREVNGSSFTMVKYVDEKVGGKRKPVGSIVYKVMVTSFEYAVMALAQVAERMGMDKADAMVAVSDALEVG